MASANGRGAAIGTRRVHVIHSDSSGVVSTDQKPKRESVQPFESNGVDSNGGSGDIIIGVNSTDRITLPPTACRPLRCRVKCVTGNKMLPSHCCLIRSGIKASHSRPSSHPPGHGANAIREQCDTFTRKSTIRWTTISSPKINLYQPFHWPLLICIKRRSPKRFPCHPLDLVSSFAHCHPPPFSSCSGRLAGNTTLGYDTAAKSRPPATCLPENCSVYRSSLYSWQSPAANMFQFQSSSFSAD